MRFELRQLDDFDEASLMHELKRVATLMRDEAITREAFDARAKVSSHTLIRRFGSWRAALERAGLANRYSGRRVSARMRSQGAKGAPDSLLIEELQRVAALASGKLTRQFFDATATFHSATLDRRFGSWGKALRAAGLEVVPLGRRHSSDDYFENLLAVWAHLGRQPNHRKMNAVPSRITGGAYEKKFGTWKRALKAFVERVNQPEQDRGVVEVKGLATSPEPDPPRPLAAPVETLSLGLRYQILRRDRFQCVLCGRSPSAFPGLDLHVDHIVHRSRGGTNESENLRTLCGDCNIGRGSRP